MRRAGLMMLAVMLMAGCGAPVSVSVDRYALNDTPPDSRTVPFEQASVRLRIGTVRVAPILRQEGIVYQTDERRFAVARRHRWAQPLPDQLHRSLYGLLARFFDTVAVVSNGPTIPGKTWTLSADVDAFHGRFDGSAVVRGSWWLQDPDGSLVLRQRFDEKVSLESDGYDALVDALSEGWRRVATAMAEHSKRTFEIRSSPNEDSDTGS